MKHVTEDDLLGLIRGELPPAAAREVEEHAQTCARAQGPAGALHLVTSLDAKGLGRDSVRGEDFVFDRKRLAFGKSHAEGFAAISSVSFPGSGLVRDRSIAFQHWTATIATNAPTHHPNKTCEG